MNQDEVVLKAVMDAHNSEFKLTAIKGELEGGLGRSAAARIARENGYCTNCERGRVACGCCGEEDTPGYHECRDDSEDCPECNGTGRYECSDCDRTGQEQCGVCNGKFYVRGHQYNFGDNTECLDFLLKHLSQYGLARRRRASDDFSDEQRGDHYGKWVPKSPLVFSMVYSDGGDTEWTFTLLVKDAQKALLLPKFIEAFNALAAAVREAGGYNEINIDNAGMHMALLNSPNGEYEWSPSSTDTDRRFPNFRKSMQLLIPALYFLGASDGRTRSMNPRTPQIDDSDKYSAIYYQGGALEFRVFDTCYNRPEQILDNLVVMCNSLKYWSTEYKRNNLNKVTRQVRFGVDKPDDRSLTRLYQTFEHIELLNNGLKLLKPSYLSISELKKQREFTVSKRTVKKVMSELYKNAEVQYQEYERRFGWDEVMRENNYIARELEALRNTNGIMPTATAIRKARKLARDKYHQEMRSKQTKEDYTKDYIEEKHTKTCGRWTLGEVN